MGRYAGRPQRPNQRTVYPKCQLNLSALVPLLHWPLAARMEVTTTASVQDKGAGRWIDPLHLINSAVEMSGQPFCLESTLIVERGSTSRSSAAHGCMGGRA